MSEMLLDSLLALSSAVYGGTVVTFAVLLLVQPRATGRPASEIARVWRSAGPILGLSMGGWVLAMIAGRYLAEGHLAWAWQTGAERRDLAEWLVFGALWFSSFILEIWTMDPLRAQVDDATGRVKDEAAFLAGYAATSRHLLVNAALVVAWQLLR